MVCGVFTIISCSSSESNNEKKYVIVCGSFMWEPGPIKIDISQIHYSVKSDSLLITGTITDTINHEGLIGALVRIVNEDNTTIAGAATDLDGHFNIKLKYSYAKAIEFSYVGYITQTHAIQNFIKQHFKLDTDQ